MDDITVFGNEDEELNINEDENFFPVQYDHEKVFDQHIEPVVKMLQNMCNEYGIPMLTAFQYKHNEQQTMICTTVVIPPDRTCAKLGKAMQSLLK